MDRRGRWGWSAFTGGPGPLSPFSSGLGHDGQPPDVRDEDFSYITSEDLETHGVEPSSSSRYHADPRASNHRIARQSNSALEIPDDDVILIKHRGVTYPEHFPAFSIGDGKLIAGDIRDRVQLVLKLSDRRTRQVKMLYKGKQLKDDEEAVCHYGVKNKSEVMIVLPEDGREESGSETSEEIVVVQVGEDGEDVGGGRAFKKNGKKNSRRKQTSPRDSSSSAGLSVPHGQGQGAGGDKRPSSTSRAQSPASGVSIGGTGAASTASAPAAPGSPMDKLNIIANNFKANLLPLCLEYTTKPPSDPKKLDEEHRKITETVLQQTILKLDEVDTGGDAVVRTRRKELVKEVQGVLKNMDDVHERLLRRTKK